MLEIRVVQGDLQHFLHFRVSSPGGGGRISSDIFNTSEQPSPARKVRDNQKSSIVNTGVGIDTNGNLKVRLCVLDGCVLLAICLLFQRSTLSPRHQENTKNRLFGANGDASSDASPRRNNDTWRSHIMFTDAAGQVAQDVSKRTPKKRIPSGGKILGLSSGTLAVSVALLSHCGSKCYVTSISGVNPITGSPLHHKANGFTPSHTNGYSNGTSSYDHDEVLTVMFGSEGHGPVAVLNGHGNVRENGDHQTSTPRRRVANPQ